MKVLLIIIAILIFGNATAQVEYYSPDRLHTTKIEKKKRGVKLKRFFKKNGIFLLYALQMNPFIIPKRLK